MVRYTVAMCSYNMSDTIRKSVESIIKQVDDNFEMLVVDGGSTDGTISILCSLDEEYENFRYITGNDSNLAEGRNKSFREAKGDHILESLDVDDVYSEGINDFVTIYESLNDQIDRKFYLKGDSINMAPRSLLLNVPYRSMGYGEDRDLWRRLLHYNKLIWLEHSTFYESIGYQYGLTDKLKNSVRIRVSDFRSGVTLWSYLVWVFDNMADPVSIKDATYSAYYIISGIFAYIIARNEGIYSLPSDVKSKGTLDNLVNKRTLPEIEEEFGVYVDRNRLTDTGKEIFIP